MLNAASATEGAQTLLQSGKDLPYSLCFGQKGGTRVISPVKENKHTCTFAHMFALFEYCMLHKFMEVASPKGLLPKCKN